MDKELKRTKEYSGIKHRLSMAETAIYLAFFLLMQFSGTSLLSVYAAQSITNNIWLATTIYMVIIGVLLHAVTFLLEYYDSFVVEHRFGLSRQGLGSWLSDYLKQLLLGGVIYLFMLNMLYYFLRAKGGLWWLYTSLAYFFVSILFAKIFPVIVIPLFYKLTKMTDENLREKLLSLAQKSGVRVLDIYNIGLGEKTRKANAAVCGLGSTKRILLSDTLLEQYSQDEIEAVLAHELVHHQKQHFWKLNAYGFMGMLLTFFILNILLNTAAAKGLIGSRSDISAFPLLALLLMLVNIILLPVFNLISRNYEREADKGAIALTGNPQAFKSLMKKLTAQNMSDPDPGMLIKIFFYDHPPADERIRACDL